MAGLALTDDNVAQATAALLIPELELLWKGDEQFAPLPEGTLVTVEAFRTTEGHAEVEPRLPTPQAAARRTGISMTPPLASPT
jgi:hypothetical protein